MNNEDGERELGLRERKKLKMRRDIERTALQSVLERGYDETTIELICREVEISKKTFFNYFSSKEAALLGDRHVDCSAETLGAALEAAGDRPYLKTVTGFVSGVLYPASDSPEVMHLRSQVIAAIPQLAFRSRKDMVCLNKTTSDCLRTYLSAHPERRVLPEQPLDAECIAAMSTALNIARSRYLLALCCPGEWSADDAGKLLWSYLDRAGRTIGVI